VIEITRKMKFYLLIILILFSFKSVAEASYILIEGNEHQSKISIEVKYTYYETSYSVGAKNVTIQGSKDSISIYVSKIFLCRFSKKYIESINKKVVALKYAGITIYFSRRTGMAPGE